jgi:hypothetical protein
LKAPAAGRGILLRVLRHHRQTFQRPFHVGAVETRRANSGRPERSLQRPTGAWPPSDPCSQSPRRPAKRARRPHSRIRSAGTWPQNRRGADQSARRTLRAKVGFPRNERDVDFPHMATKIPRKAGNRRHQSPARSLRGRSRDDAGSR